MDTVGPQADRLYVARPRPWRDLGGPSPLSDPSSGGFRWSAVCLTSRVSRRESWWWPVSSADVNDLGEQNDPDVGKWQLIEAFVALGDSLVGRASGVPSERHDHYEVGMTEPWALCPTCDRWFYPETVLLSDAMPRCPVCTCSATRLENRTPRNIEPAPR